MDAGLEAKLPLAILSLVQAIETHMAEPIALVRDSAATLPFCEVTDTGARIFYYDFVKISDYLLLHELLHIQRYAVKSVPQLVARGNPSSGPAVYTDEELNTRGQIVEDIENALEHLVIVPRSAQYGLEPYEYWNENIKRRWSTYPWPEVTCAFGRRHVCLLEWLIRDLLTDQAVADHLERCLRAEGVFDQAETFRRSIREVLPDKNHCVAIAAQAIGIPLDDIALARLEFPGRHLHCTPVLADTRSNRDMWGHPTLAGDGRAVDAEPP